MNAEYFLIAMHARFFMFADITVHVLSVFTSLAWELNLTCL